MTKAFMAAFGLIGVAFLSYTVVQFLRAHRSRRWPSVRAEVVEVRVNETRGRRTRYEPFVRYRYSRNGTVHEGHRILFIPFALTSSQDDTDQFVAQFQVGSSIAVRVSPTNDKLSVIEPGIQPRWFFAAAVFALAFITIGASSLR